MKCFLKITRGDKPRHSVQWEQTESEHCKSMKCIYEENFQELLLSENPGTILR